MSEKEWLFGPSGDMQPLPPPDSDIDIGLGRIGGTHESLIGTRTVDSFGYRREYSFTLPLLEDPEYSRLEGLFTGAIPEPLFLLNPMSANLASRESSTAQPLRSRSRGLSVSAGTQTRVKDRSVPVSWLGWATRWSGASASDVLRVDEPRSYPAMPWTVTVSAYVRSSSPVDVRAAVTVSGDTDSRTTGSTVTTGTGWSRISVTVTLPDGAESWTPELEYVSGSADLYVSVVQVERADAPTDPVIGGGLSQTSVDTFDTPSPRYPLRSVNVSIVEV